jgi:hypothetical protein
MVHRIHSSELTARMQSNLQDSSDALIIRPAGSDPANVRGRRDLGKCRGRPRQKSSEAVVASVIVIAVVTAVAGVLAGAFIAVSIAIHRGYRVRSLIWKASGRPAQSARPLSGSARRP